jgi:geranylgeranyl reductase family protein
VPETFAVIVVGGGPAGAAAAHAAAAAGLEVCLIDKAAFPREKLCGGGLTERCRRSYESLFGEAVPTELAQTCERMAFFRTGTPLSRMGGRLTLTLRRTFDAHLVGRAQATGARTLLADGVESIDIAARTVRLKSGRVLGYGHLVGCDGVSSGVAKALFGQAFDRATIGFGLEVEVPCADMPDQAEEVEIDFGAARWGYGWVFPKGETFTIGVGGMHRRNPDLKARLAAYLKSKGLEAERYKVKGQYLPWGDKRPAPGRGRVLLCGDAAGFVDPITGEGIGYALDSGAAAGAAIARAVAAGRPDEALAQYLAAVAPIRRSMRQARGWRVLIYPRLALGLFSKVFPRARIVREGYLEIMAGTKEYGDLWGVMARQIGRSLGRRLGWAR